MERLIQKSTSYILDQNADDVNKLWKSQPSPDHRVRHVLGERLSIIKINGTGLDIKMELFYAPFWGGDGTRSDIRY